MKLKRDPGCTILTWEAPWTIYSLACSQRPGPEHAYRFALGSFIEEYSNKVQIIQLDEERGEFVARSMFDHSYPTTKIMWAPETLTSEKDLIATTGDYLRLWNVQSSGETKLEAVFNNAKKSEYCAPLTSFDWNPVEPSMIATCSIDTTCSIWDLATKRIKTQLIAHDKEVYDLAWSKGRDVFATVGADGSLRMFDLRNLQHSSIMYESQGGTPLLRLVWNRLDPNYLATFQADACGTVVLDVRMPAVPVACLAGHTAHVNGVAWAPHSACHLCTVGDDRQALIWDLSPMPRAIDDPILAYTAQAEINATTWSSTLPEWVCIAFGNKMQILKV